MRFTIRHLVCVRACVRDSFQCVSVFVYLAVNHSTVTVVIGSRVYGGERRKNRSVLSLLIYARESSRHLGTRLSTAIFNPI
jgi:hypothetical protein